MNRFSLLLIEITLQWACYIECVLMCQSKAGYLSECRWTC